MKITRKQLRKMIQEIYAPGMEKTMHRSRVMDPKMVQDLADIESSGISGMEQAQDLALTLGSEEAEVKFLDSEMYSEIERKNKQFRRNAKILRRFLMYFEKLITSLGISGGSKGPALYAKIPGVKGNPVKAGSIKTGLADTKAFVKNLVGGDHAYAEIKLQIEGIPDTEVVVHIEDNMYAYSRYVTISLTHDPSLTPVKFSIALRDNRETMMEKARDLDATVRKIILKLIRMTKQK